MTGFDEREKGYERKFERDQELAFKAKARRNKLLGLWAAAEMGLSGAAAQTYAAEVVSSDLQHHGETEVVQKIVKDAAAKGKTLDPHRIRDELQRCAAEAKKQLGIAG